MKRISLQHNGLHRTYKRVYNTSQQELIVQKQGETYLVTIAPWVVLHTHVLVGVLGAFLERGHVLPVLPMLHPEIIGIDAGEGQARDNGTRDGEYICRADRVSGTKHTRWQACARDLVALSQLCILADIPNRTQRRLSTYH